MATCYYRERMGMKLASTEALTKKDILGLVREDLAAVEARVKDLTHSAIPLIDHINKYLHGSGGKRLRPAVLLLCSKLCGFEGKLAIELAGVVELIHAATLVHDDIIDHAHVRRGRPSVNSRWGNQITVLMGDWMYMTSFQIALQLRNLGVLDVLIEITRGMVESELIQLQKNGRTDVSAEEQMAICRGKTASLFSGCGRLAAMIAGAGPGAEEKLATYGLDLGITFQLTDDLLDYTSNQAVLGKPVLKDLEEGKVTLPIIYLLERADRGDRDFIREVVGNGDLSDVNKEKIIQLVRAYDTLTDVRNLAERHAAKARQCLHGFPDSIYREALLRIPELITSRTT
ncbi:MAG: polyprenyl synthetase family protein [Acidobacteriota bacterium]